MRSVSLGENAAPVNLAAMSACSQRAGREGTRA
jgi:hypothetical protein